MKTFVVVLDKRTGTTEGFVREGYGGYRTPNIQNYGDKMITIEYNGTLIEIPNNMYRAFEDEQGEALDFLGDDDSPDIVLNDEQFQKMVELAKRSKIASYIISELTKSGAEYENAPYRKWETGAAYDPDEPEPDELTDASGEFEESEHPKTGTWLFLTNTPKK